MKKISKLFILFCLSFFLVLSSTSCKMDTVDDDKTQVKIWVTWDIDEGGSAHELKLIVDEYNQSQDSVEVVLEKQSGDSFSEKLYMSVANGVGPDAALTFANTLPEYVENNLLAEMDKYIDTNTLSKRLSKNQLDECYGFSDKKLHIVPVQSTTTVLFYNKTLFDELNLSVPNTWQEISTVSEKIYDAKKIKGFSAESYTDLAQMLFMQTGAKYIDTEKKCVGFETEECQKVFDEYIKNVDNNYYAATYQTGSLADDFNSGKLAAFVATCTYENYISPNGFELGIAPSPVGENKWAPAFNRGIVAFKSTEKKEQAICNFIEYFTNKHNSARWCISIDSLSPYNDVSDDSDYIEYINTNPVLNAACITMDYAQGTPAVIGAAQVRNELKNMFLDALSKKKTTSEAMKTAIANSNSALKGG